MLVAVAIEEVAEQAAPQVRRSHEPVRDREREVHVVVLHDALVVMRGVVPADGVDERHVAHERVVLDVAAVVEGLVDQVLPDHGDEQDVAGVRVDQLGCDEAEAEAATGRTRSGTP